jgi:hypothetical protein
VNFNIWTKLQRDGEMRVLKLEYTAIQCCDDNVSVPYIQTSSNLYVLSLDLST